MKVSIFTEGELSELIRKTVKTALSEIKQSETTKSKKLSRTAAAQVLGVSVSTLDRISKTQPDLLPKHRDGTRPFFYRADIDRYLEYTGKKKIT